MLYILILLVIILFTLNVFPLLKRKYKKESILEFQELKQIKETSLSIEGVLGVHQLRTRRSGPIRFIQLHLELEDNIPLIEAHRISDEVEDKLISVFPDADVLIHQDPYSVVFGPEKQQKFHSW